jgi:MEDS: MEthanogen/methylotroph, DcmR Sensory domain
VTKCCDCVGREIRLHSGHATALTLTEQLAYLRAEHVRLLEQFRALRSEFEALRRAHVLPHEWAATFQRMREFRNLLANHRIGLEWMRYPPCGRTSVPSPLCDTRVGVGWLLCPPRGLDAADHLSTVVPNSVDSRTTSQGKAPHIVYQQGDHVCTMFRSPEERIAAAIEYISGGLERGERCLYVCGEQTPDEFRVELRRAGIEVEREEKRGALILMTTREGHLKGGSFGAAKMIEMLRGAVKDALDAGFAGLCAAGDMNWLLDDAPGSHEILEYEALLNHFFGDPTNKALGLCQYNRNTLPATILDTCMATHRHVRIADPMIVENPFYELPELAMSHGRDGADVTLKLTQIDSLG